MPTPRPPPTDRYIDSRSLLSEFRRKHKDDRKFLLVLTADLNHAVYFGCLKCRLQCFLSHNIESHTQTEDEENFLWL